MCIMRAAADREKVICAARMKWRNTITGTDLFYSRGSFIIILLFAKDRCARGKGMGVRRQPSTDC